MKKPDRSHPYLKLFTIGMAQLVWWKVILGIVVWPYIAMTICCAVLFATLRFVHSKRRKLLRNAALVGSGGILTAFTLTKPICSEFEPLFLFVYYLVIVIAMLGFMSLSGFLAKQ